MKNNSIIVISYLKWICISKIYAIFFKIAYKYVNKSIFREMSEDIEFLIF